MKYIEEYSAGDNIKGVFFVKEKNTLTASTGKPYDRIMIADKTGTITVFIWNPDSPAIEECDAGDYIKVQGTVADYQGHLQVKAIRINKADENEYDLSDYIATSDREPNEMYSKILEYIDKVETNPLKKLLKEFLVNDSEIVEEIKKHSAAKSLHHNYMGGLLEHTLNVVDICYVLSLKYKNLNRDLLLTAAILHDIAKIYELSNFPDNTYTDDGQLLGHIVMGIEMIHDKAKNIEGFTPEMERLLKHCILSHHGEFEFGSPKKPAILEAFILNAADNIDAKAEMFRMSLKTAKDDWAGYNKALETYVRKTPDFK